MKKTLSCLLLLAVCALAAVSCSKEDVSSAPVVIYDADVSDDEVTLKGKLNVAEELMSSIEVGFEYSENADMSSPTKLAIKSMGINKKFQQKVEWLKSETKYYYCAYVKYLITDITIYSAVKSFTTSKIERHDLLPDLNENNSNSSRTEEAGYENLAKQIEELSKNIGKEISAQNDKNQDLLNVTE